MPGIMRTQFRKFFNSNPVGRRLKPVLDNKIVKVAISYVFIISTGLYGFVLAKKAVDWNRVEILRSRRRIKEADKKHAEELHRQKRASEETNKDSS